LTRFTRIFNLVGNPCLSIPCGFSFSGMPIGLQIAGKPFDEETVLRIGYAYEMNSPGRIIIRLWWAANRGEIMISPKIVYLKTTLLDGSRDLVFTADHLICGAGSGGPAEPPGPHRRARSPRVPAPQRIPIYMNFSTYLLTTDDEITVVGEKTSGEVEYVLLCSGDETWVSVGSDHTDRDMETKSIPGSKQMYAKCLAPECWPYPDVKDHWDRLVLRCWVTKGAERSLYQEAPLAEILDAQEMLEKMPREGMDQKGCSPFSRGRSPPNQAWYSGMPTILRWKTRCCRERSGTDTR